MPDTQPEAKKVDLDELETRFKQYLYAQNGKVTNERLALLRTMYSHDGHFNVDQLLDLMNEQDLKTSRATVYRTLDLLVQSGLVKKLILEDQEARYEAALTSGHHDHIICTDCDRIIEFFSPELETLQDDILRDYHMKPVKHIHQLYGSCTRTDCPEKKAKTGVA